MKTIYIQRERGGERKRATSQLHYHPKEFLRHKLRRLYLFKNNKLYTHNFQKFNQTFIIDQNQNYDTEQE